MENDEAVAEMLNYGYRAIGRLLVRSNNRGQRWEPLEQGGFLRFEADMSPMPMKVSAKGEGMSGLDYRNPAMYEYFEWVWPAAEVHKIYYAANRG